MSYKKVKQKYEKELLRDIRKEIQNLQEKDVAGNVIYNKYELHDTRILIGVLTDLLLKHKVITEAELKKDLESAYKDELQQHKPHKMKNK